MLTESERKVKQINVCELEVHECALELDVVSLVLYINILILLY